MPVPEYSGPNVSIANGIATVFPYDFLIFDEEHIEVAVDDVVQTLGVDYTVSGVGSESGGDVTFLSAPDSGAQVVRDRQVPYVRTAIDYQEGGPFQAEVIDEDVDLAEMQIQQLAAAVKRTFKAPRSVSTDQVVSEEEWAARAGTVVSFDALGVLRLIAGQVGSSLVDLAAAAGSSLIGFIQAGAGAVLRSVQDKNRDVVSVKDFGAVGDGVTDDTAAFTAWAVEINALGGAIGVIPPGTYNVTVPKSSQLCAFASLKGLDIVAGGAVIADQQTYASTENGILFQFVSCMNIRFAGAKITAQNNMNNVRGTIAFQFAQGCRNIDLAVEQEGGLAGVIFYNDTSGTAAEMLARRSRNYRIKGKFTNIYYPVNGQFSGDNGDVIIETIGCGRAFYYYGVSNVRIMLEKKNSPSANSIIGAASGYGCSNFDVFIRDRDSTTNGAAVAGGCEIQFADTTAAEIRNIRIGLDIVNPAASPWGNSIGFIKADGAGGADSTGRGHVLDGLEIYGYSKQVASGGRAHINTTLGAFVTSGTPDVLRNVKVHNFTGRTAGGLDGWQGVIAALEGRLIYDSVNYDTDISVLNGSVGRVVFIGCRAPNFSDGTGETDLHDLISCQITSGTDQAIAGKRFINSPFSRTGVNIPAQGEWISPAFSAGDFTGNGSMTWTVAAGDVTTYEYTLVGKTMTINFAIATSTVGGTPNNELRIAIPSGFTPAKTVTASLAYANDNGTPLDSGIILATASAAFISCFKNAAVGAWAAATDTTHVRGSITFEVA